MPKPGNAPYIAIACGGTGGHLFPGIAVGEALLGQGVDVGLWVSKKEVDQAALKAAPGMRVETLEAVGLDVMRPWEFVAGVWRSWRRVKRAFAARRPSAVLAMGGFTSVGPVLEARRLGIRAFLHESNSIPGRANRWLAPWVETVFVGFAEARGGLRAREVRNVGTPVRKILQIRNRAEHRRALGLHAEHPVLLVVGGSQGAHAINETVMAALGLFRRELPELQFLHLSGTRDAEKIQAAYASEGRRASVYPFLDSMESALGAADVAVSRAGASSLAELAAVQLPSLLVPYPMAADDHQVSNARIMAESGAAEWCPQGDLTPEVLVRHLSGLLGDAGRAQAMREALARWHRPGAAGEIASCLVHCALPGRIGTTVHRPERLEIKGRADAEDGREGTHGSSGLALEASREVRA